jgi:prephenate dehydrogenase|tara:strand:+ start:2906 stop:3130 length:225 start_codon:yes stop_codon:yes gene_type:complete
MQPEEWNEKERIERDANLLWAKMVEVEKYNLLRAVDELSELFEVIDKDFAMTEKQRDYYKRARITFDKIFNTNQ